MTAKEKLISQIAAARKNKGLTQVQLSKESGVTQTIIARVETGTTNPNLETMLRMLAPLGKTLQVVDESSEKK